MTTGSRTVRDGAIVGVVLVVSSPCLFLALSYGPTTCPRKDRRIVSAFTVAVSVPIYYARATVSQPVQLWLYYRCSVSWPVNHSKRLETSETSFAVVTPFELVPSTRCSLHTLRSPNLGNAASLPLRLSRASLRPFTADLCVQWTRTVLSLQA